MPLHFEKVDFKQFVADVQAQGLEDLEPDKKKAYDAIPLPKRATAGSAGYDFSCPWDIRLAPGQSVTIPTGIRAAMPDKVVLMVFPRSGLGTRYRMQLANTVGIIDSDYFFADNQGHIMIRITNDSKEGKTLDLQAGERFAQGVFLPFYTTEDDDVRDFRTGGHGSTGK